MRLFPLNALSALCIAGACLSAAAAPAARYSFTDLGTLGGNASYALDINNLGWVTGNAQLGTGAASPRLNGFVYAAGVMNNIGVLPGSNNFSRGYAINDAGVVVGESDNGTSRAFVLRDGTMTGLTRLAGDSDRGVAHDINNSGVIVGISSNGVASRPTQWVDGVATDLGTLDGATTSTGRARGINDAGQVVGNSRRDADSTLAQATLWNGAVAGSRPYNLGGLSDDGFSEAYAINGSGWVAGLAVNGYTGSGTEIRQAVLWEPRSGDYDIRMLGSLGLTFSEARDINDAGQIVGFATNISGSPQRAFLWQDGEMADLNSLYDASALGFTFRTAEGINRRGDIVGWGLTAQGATHAYMLAAVPEPQSWAMMFAGLMTLAYLARCRASR